MKESTFLSSFQVGDLITLKHHRGNPDAPAPLAIVVGLEALVFDRIMIQHRGTSGPEMAAPGHWIVVSRNENR
jgi:hypothetical protein